MAAPSLDLSFLQLPAVRKRIAVVAIAGVIAGLLYGSIAAKWYRSLVTVVPAKPQRPGISGVLGAEFGGLAGLAPDLNGSADSTRIAAVLQSIAVSDAVIEKFDLRSRYREKHQEGAREALWRHCDVRTLPKPNLVQLTCEDTDPRFVREMLAFFADYGNQVFRRVGVSSASEEVRFLERRAAELRQQADEASARMRQFEEKYQIVDLDSQTKAVVSALATLNSQRISKELELDYARTFSAGDEATLRQLRSQLSVVDDKLRNLAEVPNPSATSSRSKRSGNDNAGGMFPAALAVPKLRAEFENLYRDRKVAEATLVFALERLEGARANEARDVSTFLVLDPPTLPTRHARPRRLETMFLFGLFGLVTSVAFEAWRSVQARRLRGRATVIPALDRSA